MDALQPVEVLREKFDFSPLVESLGLSFLEYQMLFRIREGVKLSELFITLYCSSATIYRLKQSVARKFSAVTFEQAVILAIEQGLL